MKTLERVVPKQITLEIISSSYNPDKAKYFVRRGRRASDLFKGKMAKLRKMGFERKSAKCPKIVLIRKEVKR